MDISEINPLLDPPVNREKYFTDNQFINGS